MLATNYRGTRRIRVDKNTPIPEIQHPQDAIIKMKYDRKNQKQQSVNREVLYSNERPYVSAVFGLGPEPAGISGKLRRFAFDHGENEYSHWLPLLLADRLGAIQGIIYDIKHGEFPNFIVEKGWPAQWKYDKKGLIKKIAVYTALTAGTILMLTRRKK